MVVLLPFLLFFLLLFLNGQNAAGDSRLSGLICIKTAKAKEFSLAVLKKSLRSVPYGLDLSQTTRVPSQYCNLGFKGQQRMYQISSARVSNPRFFGLERDSRRSDCAIYH
jgi:hypothetical protein